MAAAAQWAAAQVGLGYIYGATGWVCTPERRAAQATQYPAQADKILRAGARWDGVRCYDCAQLTRFAARAAGGDLPSGATSQWTRGPWAQRGTIDTLPDIPGALLYRQSGGVMQHAGVYLGGGEAVDARGTAEGVVRGPLAGYPWTHWGLLRVAEQAAEAIGTARVTGGGRLNLRAQPDKASARLMQIAPGEQVTLLDADGPEGWARIRYDGREGWVMLEYLDGGDGGASRLRCKICGFSIGGEGTGDSA